MAEKLTIFISGTMRDLPTEREQVAAAVREMGLDPVWAEKRGATDRPSRDECERMARNCHVYLGLYGLSYDWKFPPEETISASEFEWQTAKGAGKPMLIYRQKGQPDPEQDAFLKKVGGWQRGRFWYEFETLDDLLPRLRDDLARLIAESFRPERPALLADYRAHLRRLCADLPLSGIPVPLDVTLPLDRVYIKLRALPEREEAARRKAALPSDRGEELPRKLAGRLWRRREEGEEAARRLEEAKPVLPEEAIAQHDRLVILGEAGAGKSTLLRHLAWERAGDLEAPLPLLVPLGRADALVSQKGCSFLEAALDLLTEHKTGGEREALKQALADAVRDKNVLFLCDGLDEAHLARRSVVAGLEKLAADGQRLVVTSRPLGYERLAALEHFQVLPLLPEDAKAFSDRWFRALAQARSVPEAEREGWAVERAGWLQRQLDERPSLSEVARNPLLLTFLAVLAGDEPQRDLPARRKELYREYVERLFTVWETRRRQEGELSLGRLRGEEARRVALWGLYRTAWHLHRAYYYGGDEGPQAVREEIEPLLARDLGKRWEFGTLEAEALAAEVLRFWEDAGLLDVYRLAGREWLAFRHLTFQEYGAARALAEMYGNNAEGLWQCLSPHLLRPQWAGVLPLALAHLPGAQATTLVERLLVVNESDEDGQRPLFLAAAALAEGAEVVDAFHRRVVGALLNLAQTRGFSVGGQEASAVGAISALGRLVGDRYAATGLLALACDSTVDGWTRMGAAEALEELGQEDKAVDGLLALAGDSAVDSWVRLQAAEALGRLDQVDKAAPILLALVRDDMILPEDRDRAVETLVNWGRLKEVTPIVLTLARDSMIYHDELDDELDVVEKVAWVLERLAREDEDEPVSILLALAHDATIDAGVRMLAAMSLGRLGRVEKAVSILLALARDTVMSAEVRVEAACMLGQLDQWDEAVLAYLTLVCDTALEADVRLKAADPLGDLVYPGEVDWEDELLALVCDAAVAARVRVGSARELEQLGRLDDATLAYLMLVCDVRLDADVRVQAADALSRLGREVQFLSGEDETVPILLALVRNAVVDADVRVLAATSLGRLGQVDEAVPTLLTLANDMEVNDDLRVRAAGALGRLGQATPGVLAGLRALAEEPETSESVRRAAREALKRLEE